MSPRVPRAPRAPRPPRDRFRRPRVRPWSDPWALPASRPGSARLPVRPRSARPPVRPRPAWPLAPATAAGATRHARRFPRHRPLPDGIGGIDGNRFRVARLPRPIPPAGPAGRTIRPRRPPPTRSAEAARDVVLGLLVHGVGEDGVGVVDLDEVAGLAGAGDVEEPGAVRDAGGLLHVVGHDHDRVLLLELMDQ